MPRVLVISGRELEEILKPDILIGEVEKAFIAYSNKSTVTPPRTVMWVENNWWGIMQSYVPNYGVGVKVVNVIPSNVERGLPTIQALVTFFDPQTGSPLAIIEGGVLTALRTGAASAVSAKYMAPELRGPVAIIGTGYQARYQLRFVSHIYRADEVRIYDIRDEAAEAFKKYAEELGFEVTKCRSSREAIKGANLVIEASTTRTPVVEGAYLESPSHVISIGAHLRDARALDDDVVRRAEVIVVDSREAVMLETGDIRIPVESGVLSMERVYELGEVASGRKPGRLSRDGVTVFKSVGLAIQDAAAAAVAYRIATEKGIGRFVEL
ncbi:MAG: ornithine cyclodeaminase family protein [Sulfolobales archaeon]|nr:ornithine cyclodeaminase family protein [Sulfolobales archaeon]MCX8208065.1 ornithine cyclodeaminase family protein [Sulfolobales archaeon]MDW8010890.1 ornithine cyclodeaminase family protein [Sulfolobales archaeon]